jgi:hypothetical protein
MSLATHPGADMRVTVAANIHARRLENELVILDLANGDYWALDELGSRVWEALTLGQSPREIARALEGDYAVDPEILLGDIVKLVGELVRRKLVVASAPRASDGGRA